MTFQRIAKTASTKIQTSKASQSQFASRPFVPITTQKASTPQPEQAQGLVQRNTNLLAIPGLCLPPKVQAKLTIGQPGDKYEQEADAMAHQVVQRIHQPQGEKLQLESVLKEDELVSQAQGSIQRESLGDDEELQMKPMVQRLSVKGMAASQDLETKIQQARTGGERLADNIRQPMEQAFGADFSGVKVHTDAQSHQLNQSIQAKAFTTGQDVFFGRKQYRPNTRDGQELLAHELTHVVQQNGNAVQRSQEIHMRTEQSRYGVIQRDDEVDAAAHTAKMEIRRGNRRGSIDETGYESTGKMLFVRGFQNMMQEELIEKLEKEGLSNQQFGTEIKSIIMNDMYFKAILTELFKAGNCEEFSASVYTYLMRHTKQKGIYDVSMVGTHNGKDLNHGFVITSPQLVSNPADLDPETAVVIDAWYNYKVLKLSQFYNGVNPYGANLDASNIEFEKSEVSTGEGAFAQNFIEYINQVATDIYKRYESDYKDMVQDSRIDFAPEKQHKDVYTFDRNGRDVDDIRTPHVKHTIPYILN